MLWQKNCRDTVLHEYSHEVTKDGSMQAHAFKFAKYALQWNTLCANNIHARKKESRDEPLAQAIIDKLTHVQWERWILKRSWQRYIVCTFSFKAANTRVMGRVQIYVLCISHSSQLWQLTQSRAETWITVTITLSLDSTDDNQLTQT